MPNTTELDDVGVVPLSESDSVGDAHDLIAEETEGSRVDDEEHSVVDGEVSFLVEEEPVHEEDPADDEEPADDEGVAELGAPSLAAALESLLMLADDPVSPESLATVCNRPLPEVIGTLHSLSGQYRADGRGFELRDVGGAWRYYSSVECSDLVTRFVTDGRQARLSQAALETLAIVAYRQPVGRAHVTSVRGVNADGVIRTLLTRGLIAEISEDTATGAILFGTTTHFLDRMGLSSLDELPPIADRLPDMSSLDDLID